MNWRTLVGWCGARWHELLRRRGLRGDRGGNAVIELALVFPVLLSVFGGLTDFGLNMWARGKLSGAVAHGAQYAYLKKTESGANANVASAVQKAADAVLSGTVVTVVGPACFCLSGTLPPSLVTQVCTTNCANTAALPGQYVTIQALYTYSPLFSVISQYMDNSIYQSAAVRVK